MDRRQLLKIACASANITIKDFSQQNKVTDAAVHHVLNGSIKSKKLDTAINAFISRQFKSLKIKSGPHASDSDSHAA